MKHLLLLLGLLTAITMSSCTIADNGCDTYVIENFSHYEYDAYGTAYEVYFEEVVTECYY